MGESLKIGLSTVWEARALKQDRPVAWVQWHVPFSIRPIHGRWDYFRS